MSSGIGRRSSQVATKLATRPAPSGRVSLTSSALARSRLALQKRGLKRGRLPFRHLAASRFHPARASRLTWVPQETNRGKRRTSGRGRGARQNGACHKGTTAASSPTSKQAVGDLLLIPLVPRRSCLTLNGAAPAEAAQRRAIEVRRGTRERHPMAEAAAQGPGSLAAARGPHPGSGSPWRTCTAGMRYRIAAEFLCRTPGRRPPPSPSPREHHSRLQSPRRCQGGRRPRRSPLPALPRGPSR